MSRVDRSRKFDAAHRWGKTCNVCLKLKLGRSTNMICDGCWNNLPEKLRRNFVAQLNKAQGAQKDDLWRRIIHRAKNILKTNDTTDGVAWFDDIHVEYTNEQVFY